MTSLSLRRRMNGDDVRHQKNQKIAYQRLPEPLSAPDLSVVNGLESAVGMATFKVCVDDAGDVVSSTVMGSSMFTNEDINKIESMIDKTKFIPALHDNKPVSGCIKLKVNLTPRLQGGNAKAASLHP